MTTATAPIGIEEGQVFNVPAWIVRNGIVNENQRPIRFDDHKFLIEPYLDDSEEISVMKASQVGWSTLAIIKAIHLCGHRDANVIYTLPSRSATKDFVTPKVDPLIRSNPVIRDMIGTTDSKALKAIGKRFLYFRGSWDETAAISISAHVLINDEVDRSKQSVLETYRTRLDEAKRDRPDMGWVWQFSNPSIPGAGVDVGWQASDQKHWFVKCSRCNYDWYLKWPENINVETEQYICAKCHEILREEDRINGRWVKKYNDRKVSGYWISQLMAPWVTAADIIRKSKRNNQVFYNFTLGLPYVSKDDSVDRQTIVDCITPGTNPRSNVAIGVDNGVVKHYVIGNQYGIFEVGTTEDWSKIEALRNQYGATMVIDMLPYPHTPKKLIKKYRGKVWGHYFKQDKKEVDTIHWGEKDKAGIVESDRTRIIDQVVADLRSQDIWFNMTLTTLEEYINHWGVMYRDIVVTPSGIVTPSWETIEGRDDHFAFATVYWYIALQRAIVQGGVVRPERPQKSEDLHPVVSPEQTVQGYNIMGAIERATRPKRRRR